MTTTATRTTDLSPANIDRLTQSIPPDVRSAILDIESDSRALAWLMFNLIDEYERLERLLNDLLHREMAAVHDGGALFLAVADEIGLGVVEEVIAGTVVRSMEVLAGHPAEDFADKARRHGADHVRESFTPVIRQADEVVEPDRLRRGFGAVLALVMTYLTPEEVGTIIGREYQRKGRTKET